MFRAFVVWSSLATVSCVCAQERAFRLLPIHPAAEFSASAVFDVNRDGKPDLFSGGFWYEGPAWKRHFVREVESINGRFDDYSNLPLDVNGDGWTDVVSVNYRSKSLYWVEHPGEALRDAPETPWKKHVIDTPGAMETGIAADIDGDGRLDILPNGVEFAAWYRFDPANDGPRLLKHELPREVAGHGTIRGSARSLPVTASPASTITTAENWRAGRATAICRGFVRSTAATPLGCRSIFTKFSPRSLRGGFTRADADEVANLATSNKSQLFAAMRKALSRVIS